MNAFVADLSPTGVAEGQDADMLTLGDLTRRELAEIIWNGRPMRPASELVQVSGQAVQTLV